MESTFTPTGIRQIGSKMKRIMLLGDTHGNTAEMLNSFSVAEDFGCDAIVQVGDFGFWPRQHDKFIKRTSQRAHATGIPVFWVDGNHEDFAELHKFQGSRPDHMVRVRQNVMWIPRGHTWEWEGVKFLAMGGAASIDRARRTLGRSWFIEEMITDEDVEQAKPADIVIAHDAPINPLELNGRGFIIDEDSEFCRQQMRRVVSKAQPELLVHGHYHMHHDTDIIREGGYTRVVGLAPDNNRHNRALLTLEDGKWEFEMMG